MLIPGRPVPSGRDGTGRDGTGPDGPSRPVGTGRAVPSRPDGTGRACAVPLDRGAVPGAAVHELELRREPPAPCGIPHGAPRRAVRGRGARGHGWGQNAERMK